MRVAAVNIMLLLAGTADVLFCRTLLQLLRLTFIAGLRLAVSTIRLSACVDDSAFTGNSPASALCYPSPWGPTICRRMPPLERQHSHSWQRTRSGNRWRQEYGMQPLSAQATTGAAITEGCAERGTVAFPARPAFSSVSEAEDNMHLARHATQLPYNVMSLRREWHQLS